MLEDPPTHHEDPRSPEAWSDFIARELSGTRKAYLAKPDFLLGHSRAERQTTADYAGRELLELVQNAADAAAEVDRPGRVLIEVSSNCLYVANTGQPFRSGGVTSLMTAHTSDKPIRTARMIGAKGLGFRAILNWTDTPLISSGALELGFSQRHAATQVSDLARQSPNLALKLSRAKSERPPLLVFPAIGADLEDNLDPDTAAVLHHVRNLRSEGYDTVVAVPFRDGGAAEKAIDQAREFEPTFLLFVPTIQEIRIQLPDEPVRDWSIAPSEEVEGDVTINLVLGADTETQSWILRRRKGSVVIGEADRDYELAIALRVDQPCGAGVLHSFFPTSLPMPFAGLFHATLELASNRKMLEDESDLNAAVLGELGTFFAETLDELRENERISGDPLDWLVEHGVFPQQLKSLAEATWRRAKQLPLIRSLDGTWRTAVQSKIGPVGYASFLPQRFFGELAAVESRSAETVLRSRLEVPEIDPSELTERLRLADLSVSERALAIVGIASTLPSLHHDRRLLLDANLRPMPKTATPFPPPSRTDQRHSLPRWSTARFISPDLWEQLLEHAKGSTLREKIASLKGFRVTEFSVDSVINALRVRLSELLKGGHAEPDRLQAEFLGHLFALHDQKRQRPSGSISVLCKDGNWHDVTTVHLSAAYGISGKINSELYAAHPELLIDEPAVNGLPSDGQSVGEFLLWLGINKWPRKKTEPLPAEWREHVKQALPETFVVSDGGRSQKLTRSALYWEHSLKAEYETIEALGNILAAAPSLAVLAWLALDDRMDPLNPAESFRVSLQGRTSANASFRPYEGVLPEIFREIIKRSAWLRCADGRLYAPQDAMIEPGALASLFREPEAPSHADLEKYGLNVQLWRRGLERAGVVRNLSDLGESQVYRLLLELPAREIPLEVCSRFLLQVLEREHFDPDRGGADRERYMLEGMVPIITKTGREWAARKDTVYAHRDDLPKAVRSHLKLVDLPSRRNATQVAARFAIPALRKDVMSIRLCSIEAETGELATALTTRFEEARPFILAMRNHVSPDQGPLRRLRSVGLNIAKRAEMEIKIGDEAILDDLEPFQHSLDLKTHELTVTIDRNRPFDENFELGLHAISDGIAELFELQSGNDFTPLLGASTQRLRMTHLLRALPALSDEEKASIRAGIGYIEPVGLVTAVDPITLAQALEKRETEDAAESLTPGEDVSHEMPVIDEDEASNPERQNGQMDLKLSATSLSDEGSVPRKKAAEQAGVRVTGGTGPLINRNGDANRAADAEHWTVAFEESQGRYPLPVANLVGSGAFGCDCLTFNSADDREAFKQDTQRVDLIARFIEAKSGTVRFTPNEWTKAAEVGERYFVYRVSFDSGKRDRARLTIVSNPTVQRSALRTIYELLIDDVLDSASFELTPAENPALDGVE
jgi:hypothetical protein